MMSVTLILRLLVQCPRHKFKIPSHIQSVNYVAFATYWRPPRWHVLPLTLDGVRFMSLHHLRILDLSSGIAPCLSTLHLADHGANVLHLPVLAPPTAQLALTHRGKALHVSTSSAQRASLIRALLPQVDVVLEDGARSALTPDLHEMMRTHHIIHARMPDFSSQAPETARAHPLPHGALEAYMGLYEVPLGRRPVTHHLALIDVTSAASMTCAILAALIARARHGHAHHIELARAEIAYPLLELNAMFTAKPPAAWNTLTWAATPFIAPYRCQDGAFIYLHAGLSHHLQALLDCLRALEPGHHNALREALSQATLHEPTCVDSMREHHYIIGALERLFMDRTAAQWEEILSSHGLCAVRVRTLDEWCAPGSHARLTGQVVGLPSSRLVPGPAARLASRPATPDTPVHILAHSDDVIAHFGPPRLARKPVAASKAPDTLPLHGVKVLDLTHVIAGPTSTRQLAELGADVLRVENPHFDAPWVQAFHIAYNAGKRSMTLDLREDAERSKFRELLEDFQPDIIALNLRPGAGASSDVTEDRVREVCPQIIYAHMTAYGEEGPWGDRPGWEQTAQAVTGVQMDWGADSGVPDLFPLPFNDLCTGLHGTQAMLLALLDRFTLGEEAFKGERVSTSLSQTSLWMQARVLSGLARPQHGKSNLGAGPLQRFYRTKDGWGYMAVHNLEALYVVDGLERLQGAQGRALEMSLEAELAAHSFATWVKRFHRAGLGRSELTWVKRRTQREVLSDAYAQSSGLVHRRAHQGVGLVTETGSAIKIDGERLELSAAPIRDHVSPSKSSSGRLPWVVKQAKGALAMGLTRRRK